MDQIIVPVLLFTSASIGAAAGLRFNGYVLVPIAVFIALVSAAVLQWNGFGTGSGIATITACLVVNQAAYIIVQIFTPTADLLSDEVANSEPSPSREQTVRGNDGAHGDQKTHPFATFDSGSSE
ncbi:hypothetical protein NB311A_20866 [Nitrobacter sp. Nb-311A]|uniref:hypothetical protein n=1 Tax=Nitrobacter sp. Nb-311A TaxID=314253 RepID=UPI0000687AC5|nr:hypothetical protein [Nitrobacter sp. Nb-311A]EAQ36429.1 hypothetical protein NB311A_20866 [Nitrobacter sp. Nb-311A]